MNIDSTEWKNLLVSGISLPDILLQPHHAEQFAAYALELIRWNQKINLTAITDPEEVAIKHFADCLFPARIIPDGSKLLDIGSGAGFPGIVLKIIKPSLKITLIEASRKKVSFQKHIIRLLNLKGIEAYHIRAEEAAKNPDFSAIFDAVICRAFSSAVIFVSTALPFLNKTGRIIAMMGKFSEKETEIVRNSEISCNLAAKIEKYVLPVIDADRTIVSFMQKS